ncbi:putative ribonuclease H-like domain-containing protein [Tanacetum coccineum]
MMLKARGLLLMALPNEHQLTFSQYPDAKSMFAAIETRFGESLDSIFNRLQKIVSRFGILGVIIAQEDLNLKFLSSLPPEWNTHVVVWRNKPEIETMSIDDLCVKTFSNVEQSAASPSVNTASPQVCTASVSDNTVYAFMVENPNGSNVLHQDLEQIHEDDLEAMDLKWQLSLLSVRAKKYYQKTGKKIFINGNDIAGYDKSKVECLQTVISWRHFARECHEHQESKEDQFRNQDNTRKKGNKEDTSKAMLAIDGVGFDWSDMAEEQVQTNMALMAFSDSEITDKSKKGLGYSAIPPPHPLIYNRPNKLDMSYSGLDEFKEPEFKGYDHENNESMDFKPEKKTVTPTAAKIEKPVKKSVRASHNIMMMCLLTVDAQGHMTGNIALIFYSSSLMELPDENQILLKIPRKDNMYNFVMKMTKHVLLVLKGSNTELLDEMNEIFIKEIENLVDKKVKIIRSDNGTEFKNKVLDDFCREKGIKREYNVARTPQQNGVAERRNMTLIEAARTMLADSKLPTTFWAEAVSTACYVHIRVLVVKPHNKTPYELFRGFKLAISFMRPFGCHVTILNTLDSLGKFDGKSDKGFFVGYSLSSKAFRVYNTRTRRVEENLHIGFLENKPMIEGNGTQGELNADVGNGEPKSAANDQKQVKDGPDNENDEKDKSKDDSSPKEVNTVGQHVNTASLEVNTGRFKLNTVDPSVNTASSNDQDGPKDMFTMGASHTLEATHVEFFSDEDKPEVDLGNITNSYTVPLTPNTRIHKDHPITNVIGDIEPTSITKALSDSSWVEAMHEEHLQFKLQ